MTVRGQERNWYLSAGNAASLVTSVFLGSGLAHTVLEIPSLHAKKLRRLAEIGVIDLSRVPGDFELNELQKRVTAAATLSNRLAVEPGLNAVLKSIEWPCHYLDFETVSTFLPLYSGYGCHEQVLTQFSIHHRNTLNTEPSHSEYLADASEDCQRELAEALIEALQDHGAIIAVTAASKGHASLNCRSCFRFGQTLRRDSPSDNRPSPNHRG